MSEKQAQSQSIPPAIPPDWKLPKGVDRALWQYLNNEPLAREYDRYLRDSPLAQTDIDMVLDHSNPDQQELIDLGCGTGRLLAAWEKLGGRGVGVDLSRPMLDQASHRLGSRSTIRLIQANLTDLAGIDSGSFDRAACLYSTLGMLRPHHTRIQALRSFNRVVRPGGKLFLHCHNLWSNLYHGPGRAFLWRNGWQLLRGNREAGDFINPTHNGIAGLSLHMYGKAELSADLRAGSWVPEQMIPLGFDGKPMKGWIRKFRAAGWFAIARKDS